MKRLDYFKRELNNILDRQLEALEKKTVTKSFSEWVDIICKSSNRSHLVAKRVQAKNEKTGKVYMKTVYVNPDKVNGLKKYTIKQNMGSEEKRNLAIAITKLKKAIDKCENEEQLLKLVLRNKGRFSDENDKPLQVVEDLQNYVKRKSNDIETKKNNRFVFSSMTDKEREEKKDIIQKRIVCNIQNDFVPYKNDGAFDKAAKEWLKINPQGNAYTDIGEVIINDKSVVRDMHHGDLQDKYLKLQTLPAVRDILERGVYLGYEKDMNGKPIDNHYFAGKIKYGSEEKIIFCRVRENSGSESRFYVHEVFTEDEIKKANHVPTNGSLPQLIGKPLYKYILQDVLNVNNKDVNKSINPYWKAVGI